MPGTRPRPDAAAMISATEEFWDFERASYDDELDAWRERTAVAVPAAVVSGHSAMPGLLGSVGYRSSAPRPVTGRRLLHGSTRFGRANPSNRPARRPTSPVVAIWPERQRSNR